MPLYNNDSLEKIKTRAESSSSFKVTYAAKIANIFLISVNKEGQFCINDC